MASLITQARAAAMQVASYLSGAQKHAILGACSGEEGEFFCSKLIALAAIIEAMPGPYGSQELGDKGVVQLHYFLHGSDWYVVEKDSEGVSQAWGWVILNGDTQNAETGYISIEEIVHHGAELDLYFEHKTLAQVMAEKGAR